MFLKAAEKNRASVMNGNLANYIFILQEDPSCLMREGGGERRGRGRTRGMSARRCLCGEIVISGDGIICDHNFAYINVLV